LLLVALLCAPCAARAQNIDPNFQERVQTFVPSIGDLPGASAPAATRERTVHRMAGKHHPRHPLPK